ncbi:hypothetical protein EJB05_24673, partial [Eragrostis curvula]
MVLVLESSKLITPNRVLIPQNLSALGANLKKVKRGQIRTALEAQTSIADWRKDVINNPLFEATFDEAKKRNASYATGPRELCRFLRDWHTHCHQNLTEAMKIKYSFEILEEVAEAYFGAYLSDILFSLLMAGYDIDAWLSSLMPALPMQKEISKGIISMAFNT